MTVLGGGPQDNLHPTIEVRVKTVDQAYTDWSEIKPSIRVVGLTIMPEDVVNALVEADPAIWEVRWQWGPGYYATPGLYSGHYVSGQARNRVPGPNTKIVEVKP